MPQTDPKRKLQAIQAQRLSPKEQRTAGWLAAFWYLLALCVAPATLNVLWGLLDQGLGYGGQRMDGTGLLILLSRLVISVLMIGAIINGIIAGKKYFIRALSGVREP
jgi:hypothetical protein